MSASTLNADPPQVIKMNERKCVVCGDDNFSSHPDRMICKKEECLDTVAAGICEGD